MGLHFSGHGITNDPKTYSRDFKGMTQQKYKKMLEGKGDILVFEEDTSGA